MIGAADDVFRPVLVIASSMGLRRGEISALTWADVQDSVLHINKAYTKGPGGVLVLHAPKTNAGIRRVEIPPAALPYLTRPEGAPDDGRVVPLTPDAITRRFERLCSRLGFSYRFHSLRHYYDSVLLSLGVPDKYIMARMGHATPSMTKQVYQHLMQSKDDQVTAAINDFFS
jgi:integrase